MSEYTEYLFKFNRNFSTMVLFWKNGILKKRGSDNHFYIKYDTSYY